MFELSIADGFVEINESLGDMIKYVANEPSVGLYYIQQHAQNAVPNVIRLKNNIIEKSHEVSLHTDDLEDSIAITKSMKDCGFPIIDKMIRDIKTSLTIMSTKQPLRGVVQHWNSSYQMGTGVGSGSSSWGNWARSAVSLQNDGERGGSYFSNVLKSAKKKAGNLKWRQLDLKEQRETVGGGDLSNYGDPRLLPSVSNSSTQPDEADELPALGNLHGTIDGEQQPVIPASVDYDKFKADRGARLEEWLNGVGSESSILHKRTGNTEGNHQFDSL